MRPTSDEEAQRASAAPRAPGAPPPHPTNELLDRRGSGRLPSRRSRTARSHHVRSSLLGTSKPWYTVFWWLHLLWRFRLRRPRITSCRCAGAYVNGPGPYPPEVQHDDVRAKSNQKHGNHRVPLSLSSSPAPASPRSIYLRDSRSHPHTASHRNSVRQSRNLEFPPRVGGGTGELPCRAAASVLLGWRVRGAAERHRVRRVGWTKNPWCGRTQRSPCKAAHGGRHAQRTDRIVTVSQLAEGKPETDPRHPRNPRHAPCRLHRPPTPQPRARARTRSP